MSDTMGSLMGSTMPTGMLDQPPPPGMQQTPGPQPKIKHQGNLVIQTAPDGTVTYFPKKFYKQGIGFATEAEAKKAQGMSLSEASSMASGTKSYLGGDAAQPAAPATPATPATPDPSAAPAAGEAPVKAAPTVKPDWVIRREKLGIPYTWDPKVGAWVPANGQHISV